jgi:hypothetical protein
VQTIPFVPKPYVIRNLLEPIAQLLPKHPGVGQ